MSIPKKIRLQVYDKYGHCCAYCGCWLNYKDMQVDHIKPKCRGGGYIPHDLQGDDAIANYNPSCRMCNFRKGMLTIDQFRKELEHGLEVLERNFTYRMMRRYLRIIEVTGPIKFHFEEELEKRKALEAFARAEHGDLSKVFAGSPV